MPTFTPNFNLAKPLVNDPTDEDQWGGYLNQDLDTIDTNLKMARDMVFSPQTADYNVVIGDRKKVISVDATSGNRTVNLLSAATAGNGYQITINKVDASGNSVTIDPAGSETIEGAGTYILSSQYSSVQLISNGTMWFILSGAASAFLAEIKPFAIGTVPAGFFECNGAAISRATYSALFGAIGTTYGVGDGSTTFNIPDYRGEFLRGWDHGRGVDASRTLGSFQDFQMEDHTHGLRVSIAGGSSGTLIGKLDAFANTATAFNNVAVNQWTSNLTGSPYKSGTETRPRNVSVMYCIKY